jgi:UDP-N-acetylglucosamine 1-carboxyvinyltransferase
MPASLLTQEPLTLLNAPRLTDISTMGTLLESLGCESTAVQDKTVLVLSGKSITNTKAHYDIVKKMRASILVLGPLLARFGEAVVSLPGGCAIGARPVDIHLNALQKMGADIKLKDGYVHASTPHGLKGTDITFPMVSVGATENLLMAATLAKGETVLRNAACEPEIVDLAKCLKSMGAKIEGDGTPEIRIQGVPSLHGTTHRVIADRIELGTYMIAPAIAGGSVELEGASLDLVTSFADKLRQTGVTITEKEDGIIVSKGANKIKSVNVATEPYPGFPTDLQAQMMALLTLADGTSVLEETIFENRFMHAPELGRMGANISIKGNTATVTGVKKLRGAPVMATDLRASVSLILAALAAEGETIVNRVYHLDRGYEKLEEKLSACGASIRRESTVKPSDE